MGNKEKILQLMSNLESENIERTRAFDKADKMGQAICAFANDIGDRKQPGYLLLGVEDDGSFSGKHITDEQLTALAGFKSEGNLLPPPSMTIYHESFAEGDVAVIEVFPSSYPPIRYKGQVWVRTGPRKSPANNDDIHILEEKRLHSATRFEIMPCVDTTLSDLNLDLFRNSYLPRAIQAEVIDEDPRPIEDQLAALRFYDRQHKLPTNLGMLLFGKHPEMFIPSAYIQYVKFGGSDNGSDILAEHAYKGPLLQTIDEINSFVKVGIAAPRPVKVSALQEETISMYPDWAVRELLLNAIIHRDYQIGNAPVKFYDYNNIRLEISNPGGLYGQANPENFPYVNDYRNPLLAEAMKVMGYVNKYNRGIAKVKTEMEKNGNPTPQFDVNKLTEFRVTLLPSAKLQLITSNEELKVKNGELFERNGELYGELFERNGELNDELKSLSKGTADRLCKIIANNPGLRRKELAEKLNVSVSTLDRYIKALPGKIEHRGSKKTGGWFPKS